jgi:DNA polymerase I-like protein with 3'-5' exonuclease and polymerase domains
MAWARQSLAVQLGLPKQEAEKVYKQYHENVPFIKTLGEECMRIATNRGYVKTILGRRQTVPVIRTAKI